MMGYAALALALLSSMAPPAQMDSHGTMTAGKPIAKPSTELVVTGLGGASKTFSPAEFRALPHVTVTVHNAHNNQEESYSGVALKTLLAVAAPGPGPKVSANMQVVIAGATDGFHVAITLCDLNPECRSGQAIVADSENGEPLKTDGAFKLILTEDKRPARWARNLQSLTVKSLDGQVVY